MKIIMHHEQVSNAGSSIKNQLMHYIPHQQAGEKKIIGLYQLIRKRYFTEFISHS